MAKDLIGELGLDVAEIQKALGLVNKQLDGLQKAADKTSSGVGKIEKSFSGLIKGAKQLGAALGIAFGVEAVIDYAKSFQNLHADIQKTRSELAEGSAEAKNFNEAVDSVKGGEASGLAFKRVGESASNFLTTFKEKAAAIARQTQEGLTRNWNPLLSDKDGGAKKTAETVKLEGEDAYNQETVDRGKKIIHLQHKLTEAQGQDLGIKRNQLAALEAEAKLQFEIMEYASRTGVADENMRAAAVRGYAAANSAHATAKLQFDNELRSISASNREIQLQREGMSAAAKEAKIIADYAGKIAEAQRAGRYDLAAQLSISQQLAITGVAVGEHNMTPAQRREERRTARKFARDSRKTTAHEADLESRLQNAYFHPESITPGSELDRYRRRRANAAQAGKDAASVAKDSADARKFYTQGLADLDAIKSNFDNAFISR